MQCLMESRFIILRRCRCWLISSLQVFPSTARSLRRMRGRVLDAAARQAAEIQRKAFLHMLGLRIGDVLQPLDPDRGPIAKEEVGRIFERINDATETLCTTYADTLPADCARAPVHLQMVSLALSAQEVL